MTEQAVLFDLGGVLTDMWASLAAYEAEHGLPPRTLSGALYGTEQWRRFETGEVDRDEWLQGAASVLAQHWGDRTEELLNGWASTPLGLHAPNIELARALRVAGVRIGILSNAGPGLEASLAGRLGIEVQWDTVVSSGDVGVSKPDPRIYELTADRVGVPASACFFIDDLTENVDGARAAGMQSHHFTGDYEALNSDLRAAGYRW